jgi:peptidoglycan hydrolase-like protein with peptidoglycan-binding domain
MIARRFPRLARFSQGSRAFVIAMAMAACQDQAGDPGAEGPGIPEVGGGVNLPPIGDGSDRGEPGTHSNGGPTEARNGGDTPRPERANRLDARSAAAELARVRTLLDSEAAATETALKALLAEPLAGDALFAADVAARYQQSGGRPIFARDGVLSASADTLVEALLAAPAHALPAKFHDVASLEAALKAFAEARVSVERLATSDDPTERAWWELVTGPKGKDEAAIAAGLQLGADIDGAAMVDRIRKRSESLAKAERARAEALGKLDRLLVERLHRFAFDMRFARRAHPFRADRSDTEGLVRVRKDFDAWMAPFFTADGVDVAALIKAATPAHPDYARTIAAYAHYQQLAERFPQHLELDKDVEKLRRGKSGPAVRKLAERLKQEGYYEGELEEKFGPALEAAVIAYQQTHQLKDSGEVDRIMRQSMNRTFAERAAQLALSLQRLRESDLHQGQWRFGDTRVRGRVNIPAFEAYFFVDGQEVRRHRVVVGNNTTESDAKTGKRGKLNQTRLFSAEMATVVLNPTWNVPRRIKEQELDLLLLEEPDYYAKNNFEVKVMPDGTEMVVQQPGPGNALGLVKFLFPNEYAIYMHDTPSKKLFGRPVRAFSHGCMRTENPLDLARWMLVDLTGRLTNEKFDEVLESRTETQFALNPKIPMSTDYVTTGFDDRGRVVFYADVYGFDKDLEDGKTPYRADKEHPNTVIF